MPLFPDNARAIPGRAIPPTWRNLERWVDDLDSPSGGIHSRVTDWPDATNYFTRRAPAPPRFRFAAGVAGTRASVGMGFLNLETPRMGADLLTLDGLDENGEETGRRPELVLDAEDGNGGPDPATGFSFIALRVIVNVAAGEPARLERPKDWLTIVHRRAMPPGIYRGGSPVILEGEDRVCLWPISKLYWTSDGAGVARYYPVTMHNLQFQFERGSKDESTGITGPDKGWFFGVT